MVVIGWVLDVVRACCGVMLALEHDHEGLGEGAGVEMSWAIRGTTKRALPSWGRGQVDVRQTD